MRLRLAIIVGSALVLAAGAAPGAGARTLVVGVGDDWVKWRADTEGIVRAQRNAGFGVTKVAFPWRPGMWHPGTPERHYIARLRRMEELGQRVVVAFNGRARHAPRSAATRQQFCSYVRGVLAQLPDVRDVVVWNEVNSPSFWRPQRDAAKEYALLLGRCWDLLHTLRPDVNVISSTAPRHDPLGFVRRLGAAYAASGRTRPIVDSFGHNPYPRYAEEAPDAVHLDGYVGQGDYPALVRTITEAFEPTPQPIPGVGGVSIWYLENGFQTRTPFRAPLYVGRENVESLVPAAEQARQLREALLLAYCGQPLVGAFFNFQLADERRLAGWQSGLLWADWRPKPSLALVRATIDAIARGAAACG